MLIHKDITKVTLRRDIGLSAGTMSKLNKGEEGALSILLRICDYLDCDIGDICEAVREAWSAWMNQFEKELFIWVC